MNLRHLLRLVYALPGASLFAAGLRRKAESCANLGCLVDLTREYRFRALAVRPTQVKAEIVAFLDIVQQEDCRVVLEVGTARGGTLFLLSHVVPPGSIIVSLDLPPSPAGLGYPSWKRQMFRRFGPPQTRLCPIQVDSHRPGVAQEVDRLVGGRPFDLLFIDGDHSYEGVRQDFESFRPLLKPGGIVAFHDIVPGPAERVGGVPRYWRAIRDRGQHLELVHDWGQGGYGIGVVRPDGERPIPRPMQGGDGLVSLDEK